MGGPKVIAQENCSGCLSCALACSFNTSEKVFNPSKANIKIERQEGQNCFSVTFLEDCLGCGKCVDQCHYGVLSYDE